MLELSSGMKAYAKSLSLHIDGQEFIYKAPKGKNFAVILMLAEEADNTKGVSCDDWLEQHGWELKP